MLYLVCTPIGNLEDITLRAIRILNEVDFIACEDTRVTIKLLNHFKIKKPLISYYQHNEKTASNVIIERLLAGENAALVTDAGMPAISDPGEEIVRECLERNVPFTVIPGPSACVSALVLSGQNTGRFTFEGFLSVNTKSRKEHLEELSKLQNTIIMYEAPHKLIKTLKDLYKTLGNRSITIIRELTKIYEEVIKTTLEEAQNLYTEKSPKGEFVLIIEGSQNKEEKASMEQVSNTFNSLIKEGYSKSSAIKELASIYPIKKNELYDLFIKE
ncbi:MAG: 16S rRNA (cytidine(1402)-2'-O)-methyltransferase [Clostridia bacterium]